MVVFTTAYARHAVEAFELGALDYLLKPFGPERLAAALERVRLAVGEPAASPTPANERLREALGQRPLRRLFVRRGGAIVPVAVEEISRFEALGDYVAAHVGTQRHLLHLSLSRLEERLDPARYKRIHRNTLVNLDHVKIFRRLGKDRLVAELADGSRLEVSRTRARELRELVN
jgi:two-component system LytT family response regulator